MWNVMDIINPTVLGTKEEFREEWCSGRIVTDPDALGTYLRDQHAMVRRTKKDVSGQTPPVIPVVIPVDVDMNIMREAEAEARELAIQATTGQWNERGNAARQLDLRLRQKTGVAKAPFVADGIAAILDSGVQKILVACWHREVYDILMQRLRAYDPVMYTGSETSSQKQMSVFRFTQGESRVMLISLRSGRGLDGLQQYCSDVAIAELDWSGQVHEQVVGRLDRDGQESYPVNAYYFVTDNGSDPTMMAVNGIKRDQSDGITDPGVEREQVDYEQEETRIQLLIRAYSPTRAGALL
jgi:SNF2 family DNA or RNA helicase